MEFSAEEFVEHLLNEGEKVNCDETLEAFKETEVPAFYDKKLFRRGRTFFYENLYSTIFCKILGSMCIAALPQSVSILKMTNKTSSDLRAYRRYLSTALHLVFWYDVDFSPGSRFLTSIANVKKKHNAASKQSSRKLNYRINQIDMALTQVMMISFPLVRGSLMGIHNPEEEDLKGFIHVWRVLGSMLGMEDRFNICRDSVKETKEICEIILNKVFAPTLENPDNETVEQLRHFINGLSNVYPILEYDFLVTLAQMLCQNQSDYRKVNNKTCKDISLFVKIKIHYLLAMMECMKFKIVRLHGKYLAKFVLWMATNFPLIAYIRYGVKNGYLDSYKPLDSNKCKYMVPTTIACEPRD